MKGLIFYCTCYLTSRPTRGLRVLTKDTRLLGQSQRILLLTARWQHELQVYMCSLPPKSHRGAMEHLRCRKLTRVTNSLVYPKLKGSWYSRLDAIIRKASGKLGQIGPLVHTGFVSELRCPELRKHQTLKEHCQQICPTFAAEGDIIFLILDSKQICPLPQRETLSLSSKAICRTNTLEKIVQNRNCQWIHSEEMQKCKRSVGNCLPIIFLENYSTIILQSSLY